MILMRPKRHRRLNNASSLTNSSNGPKAHQRSSSTWTAGTYSLCTLATDTLQAVHAYSHDNICSYRARCCATRWAHPSTRLMSLFVSALHGLCQTQHQLGPSRIFRTPTSYGDARLNLTMPLRGPRPESFPAHGARTADGFLRTTAEQEGQLREGAQDQGMLVELRVCRAQQFTLHEKKRTQHQPQHY